MIEGPLARGLRNATKEESALLKGLSDDPERSEAVSEMVQNGADL